MSTKVEIKQGAGVSTFLVVLLLIACAFGAWQYTKAKKATTDKERMASALVASQDSIRYVKVKLNDTVSVMAATTKAIYMDKQSLSKLYSKEVANSKQLGARLKDIQAMQQVATVIHDSVSVPVYIDTLKRLCADYNDGFVSINTCIPTKGNASIEYTVKDSIQITEYYAPHRILWGLIKWKSRTGEYGAMSMNPKASIVGFKVEKVVY